MASYDGQILQAFKTKPKIYTFNPSSGDSLITHSANSNIKSKCSGPANIPT